MNGLANELKMQLLENSFSPQSGPMATTNKVITLSTENKSSDTVKQEFQQTINDIANNNNHRVLSLLFVFEENEGRKDLNSLVEFETQFEKLVLNEAMLQFQLTYIALPLILKHCSLQSPSSIVFLASRLIRTPNSPGQIVTSIAKRSLQSFAGSLFFEKRAQGLRCCYVNPTPGIPNSALAACLVFPLLVAPSTCVESIDLTAISPKKERDDGYSGSIFVTGGSRGIGKDIAIACARELKFSVALLGRDEAALKETVTECLKYIPQSKILCFAFDVRNNEKLKQAIDQTAETFGGLTALCNSAGINRRRYSVSPDGKKFADPLLWNELMEINVNSSFSATGYALPHLVKAKLTRAGIAPAVFFISSRAIRLGGSPGQQSYVASKMAISGFSNSIQHEVKAHGIRCLSLNVGLVATELGTR